MRDHGKINDALVLRAQQGDARAIEDVARCFADIASVYWRRSRALQISLTLEDFQQDVAVRWWKWLWRFDPARAKATTWSFMIVCTALKGVMQHDQCMMRKAPGERRPMFEATEPKNRRHPHPHPHQQLDEPEPVKIQTLPGFTLTEREVEIVHMFARGKTMAQIARSIGCSRELVRHHKQKFQVQFVDTRQRGRGVKTGKGIEDGD